MLLLSKWILNSLHSVDDLLVFPAVFIATFTECLKFLGTHDCSISKPVTSGPTYKKL